MDGLYVDALRIAADKQFRVWQNRDARLKKRLAENRRRYGACLRAITASNSAPDLRQPAQAHKANVEELREFLSALGKVQRVHHTNVRNHIFFDTLPLNDAMEEYTGQDIPPNPNGGSGPAGQSSNNSPSNVQKHGVSVHRRTNRRSAISPTAEAAKPTVDQLIASAAPPKLDEQTASRVSMRNLLASRTETGEGETSTEQGAGSRVEKIRSNSLSVPALGGQQTSAPAVPRRASSFRHRVSVCSPKIFYYGDKMRLPQSGRKGSLAAESLSGEAADKSDTEHDSTEGDIVVDHKRNSFEKSKEQRKHRQQKEMPDQIIQRMRELGGGPGDTDFLLGLSSGRNGGNMSKRSSVASQTSSQRRQSVLSKIENVDGEHHDEATEDDSEEEVLDGEEYDPRLHTAAHIPSFQTVKLNRSSHYSAASLHHDLKIDVAKAIEGMQQRGSLFGAPAAPPAQNVVTEAAVASRERSASVVSSRSNRRASAVSIEGLHGPKRKQSVTHILTRTSGASRNEPAPTVISMQGSVMLGYENGKATVVSTAKQVHAAQRRATVRLLENQRLLSRQERRDSRANIEDTLQ